MNTPLSTDTRSARGTPQRAAARYGLFSTLLIVGAASALMAGASVAASSAAHAYPTVSDAAGNLRVPEGYRAAYQYLGTWAVAADNSAGAKQMHVVYASPGAASVYRKLGHFPDGAVLVKEVYDTATAPMTTGTVSHAAVLKGWFVMVKDSTHAYPHSKVWGNGWGWSWFDADKPTVSTTRDRNECLGCHQPADASDLIYVQGYPALKP